MSLYVVKVLDAKYDLENKILVLNCFFEAMKEKRILHIPKSDFSFHGNPDVPDVEMKKTADLFKGKRFKLEIKDDPNRTKIDENNAKEIIEDFRKEISDTVEKTQKEMGDTDKQMDRRIGDIIAKQKDKDEQERKIMNGEM